jgi:hypothetical protein
MSIGQFLTEISDKTKDEDVGKSAKRLAMHLLVRSGSLRLVGEFVSRNRDFFAWDTSLIVKLIEAGDVDAAAALCGGEMKRFPFRAHGTYTKVFHDNLGRFLEKIGDPTLRYILSVSFNSMETPREEDAPSCLLRMRPLVEAFDQIHFPDEKSRVIYLSMMCKPAFFDIAGLKRALEEWDKMYDREKMIDLFGRDNAASAAAVHDALEIATMGLMLRDLRIEELGNRLEPSLVIYENTGSNENYLLRVIERLCEESLYHAGNGNLEAVAACAPLSRKIYLAMARRASKAGSDGESAHVWMDMCHSAGNTMDSIPPWIDGVGGHVAEIHRNRVAQMKFLRRNSLHDLFSCLPYSIRERWGDDEYSSKRRGAVLCFLNDDEIRKSFADKSVDLGPSGVNDIRAIYTKDILAAMDVWSEMHSDRAHQIKPIRDELIRLFPDTNGH